MKEDEIKGENKRKRDEEKLMRQLQQLVFNNYILALQIPGVKKAISDKNDGFFFKHNDTANRAVNKQLGVMARQIDYMILNNIRRSWKYGEDSFWDKVELTFSKNARQRKMLDEIRDQATKTQRGHTAEAFYNEKRNGFTISERVWNLSGNAKKEIEVILQNGIKEGKGADEIQKSLKKYLNEPDTLFRRVRSHETGQLELSKAAQAYKPGRGVYRSAYKNAVRLARTEITAALHEAEWQGYQNNPLVVGFKISLSNNHTTLVNGIPVPFHDICDDLEGVYPKDFKWHFWHPQCRCRMSAILISQSDFESRIKARLSGTLDKWKPSQSIKKPPKAFYDWMNDNRERASGWANLPRFIRQNPEYAEGF